MVAPPDGENFIWSDEHQLYVNADSGVWFDPDHGRYSDPYSDAWLPRRADAAITQREAEPHRHRVEVVEAPAVLGDRHRRNRSVRAMAAETHRKQIFWHAAQRALWWLLLLPVALACWAYTFEGTTQRRVVFAAAGLAVAAYAVIALTSNRSFERVGVDAGDEARGVFVLTAPPESEVVTTTAAVPAVAPPVEVLGAVAYYSVGARQATLAAIESNAGAHPEVDALLQDLAVLVSDAPSDVPVLDEAVFPVNADLDGDCVRAHDDLLRGAALEVIDTLDGCRVANGRWFDPYTATNLASLDEVAVVPLVSLADAWTSGAWRFSVENLLLFANSPANSTLMSTAEEVRKADFGPADYTPTNNAQACSYLMRYASVKVSWSLLIGSDDYAAVAEGLRSCDRLDDSGDGSLVVTELAALSTASATDCHPNYSPCIPYAPGDAFDCDQLDVNDILVPELDPYGLDPDGDGVACAG